MKGWMLKIPSLQWWQRLLQSQVAISISSIEEGAGEITIIEVEKEAEVKAITYLSTIPSLLFSHISQIQAQLLLDQKDLLVKSMASLVI